MNYRWKITVQAWPHSTGNGQVNDQNAAGDRERTFEIRADNMKEALKHAQSIVLGIESHPMVWQAPIMAIVNLGEM